MTELITNFILLFYEDDYLETVLDNDSDFAPIRMKCWCLIASLCLAYLNAFFCFAHCLQTSAMKFSLMVFFFSFQTTLPFNQFLYLI